MTAMELVRDLVIQLTNGRHELQLASRPCTSAPNLVRNELIRRRKIVLFPVDLLPIGN
jgi:hypothetical protein